LRRRSPVRSFAEYCLARIVLCSLRFSPRPLALGLARLYTAALDLFLPRLRRIAAINLSFALPEASLEEQQRIIDGVWRSIARLLVVFARFPDLRRPEKLRRWIRYEGYEHFEKALQRGRGVLFATAHFGNWEFSAFAHGVLSTPMHVLVRPLDNPRIDRLVEKRRTLSGNSVIGKKDFARTILKALANNQAVGVLIDQNSSLDAGVFVDFFGKPACAGTGFARLAARSGAAVIPGFALWSSEEERYVLRFFPPVDMSGDAEADTRRLQAVLESVIRLYPDQWLWIHRRWKTRPAGEPLLY